ncbi:hypothetical protein, partial [Pseudomonas sp. GM55]|uniref:hypothetical protein n=1 Tax=Pseudomonas sp. GM55 TaxID=1144333 RepID=UPI001EE63FD1
RICTPPKNPATPKAIQKTNTTRHFVFDINLCIAYKVIHALEMPLNKKEAGDRNVRTASRNRRQAHKRPLGDVR